MHAEPELGLGLGGVVLERVSHACCLALQVNQVRRTAGGTWELKERPIGNRFVHLVLRKDRAMGIEAGPALAVVDAMLLQLLLLVLVQ